MSYKTATSLFDEMHKYMFSAENLLRYTADKTEIIKETKIKKNNKSDKKSDFFYPKQHDQLFWCIYIIVKGKDNYNMIKYNSFVTEKEFKINSVEKLRLKKDLLKQNKLKKNQIEDELVNQSKIGIYTLKALSMLYELNITYVKDRIYYKFEYGNEASKNDIIICNEKGYGISENQLELNKEINSTYLYIENISKPIKCVTSYNIKDLQSMCEKLQISLLDETGKKKGKKALYESILIKF
tara:strand:+ start:461 stop:1180 length:720 start_codon:yes stop_codon:yes gene_type:complete